MQTLWGYANSIREAYNSINPATLTGAIDVIVVENADGTQANCFVGGLPVLTQSQERSTAPPFHVRFGKYQILRPSQKRV